MRVNGILTAVSFIGPYSQGGFRQVNFYLPPKVRSGLALIQVILDGRPFAREATIRIIPPAPMVPKLLGVSDGINLLSSHIDSRTIRVSLEEVDATGPGEVAHRVTAKIDGCSVQRMEAFLVDPLTRRYELNLVVPNHLKPGRYGLTLRFGHRIFPVVYIEISSGRL